MQLYKFTTTSEIAHQISRGVFRFYELLKYTKIEDKAGRFDAHECSVSFPEIEAIVFPGKIPIASFNAVEFKCISTRPGDEYLKRYFVFCMSTHSDQEIMGDSDYVVELDSDIFDVFEMLLKPWKSNDGRRFFSHGSVTYYDIHNHPPPLGNDIWKEAYIKHSKFKHQQEYRAALFASDHFFNRIQDAPLALERDTYRNGKKLSFKLKLNICSGVDGDGWRYVEFDISEFSANLLCEPFKVTVRDVAVCSEPL